jgi:hypothetical protein
MLLIAFGLFYLQGGSVALQDLDRLFNTMLTSEYIIEINNLPFIIDINTVMIDSQVDNSTWYITKNNLNFFEIANINQAIEIVNPINSIRIIALFFLFFNFFFKLTAAPFHI